MQRVETEALRNKLLGVFYGGGKRQPHNLLCDLAARAVKTVVAVLGVLMW